MRPSVAAMTIVLTATACGGGAGAGQAVTISGSSTVEPISARVAEAFSHLHPEAALSVEGPGTGDGFALFCRGETNISDASRPIKDPERENCAAKGISFVELHVAIDGLSVLTNISDSSVDCLAPSDLYALLGPESIGFDRWSDADSLAAEIGAPNAPYSDEPLDITGPGEESGTYDTFVDFIVAGGAGGVDYTKERGVDNVLRPDYTASANDNTVIEGITGSPGSLGWVGYAFYLENADQAKAISIDIGDGCVAPTPQAITGGSYPLSRPLFIYVNTGQLATNPMLVSFVDYYLSDQGLVAVTDAGYVPLADYGPVRSAWESAKEQRNGG